jgi:hypothetical protein
MEIWYLSSSCYYCFSNATQMKTKIGDRKKQSDAETKLFTVKMWLYIEPTIEGSKRKTVFVDDFKFVSKLIVN